MRRTGVEHLLLLLPAIAAVWGGVRTEIQNPGMMGARLGGAYVALLGFILACLVVAHWFTSSSRGTEPGPEPSADKDLRRVGIGLGFFLGYILLIGVLGYLLSTALFFAVCLRLFGAYRWAQTAIGSLAAAIGLAYLWEQLEMTLPQGILPWP